MSTRFRGLVPRGVIAGVIGATTLAFWFLVIDGSQGEPFRTPGFLGGALLGTDALEPRAGPVILYTLLHYVAFIGVGLGVAWSLSKIHTTPNIFLGLVLGFGLYDLVFYTSLTVTGVDVVGEFGWPPVLRSQPWPATASSTSAPSSPQASSPPPSPVTLRTRLRSSSVR